MKTLRRVDPRASDSGVVGQRDSHGVVGCLGCRAVTGDVIFDRHGGSR